MNAGAELIGGDLRQRVSLVDHRQLVVRQKAGVVLPQNEIGNEQGVIDDQQVGLLRAAAGALIETGFVGRAAPAEAIAVLAADFLPNIRRGRVR